MTKENVSFEEYIGTNFHTYDLQLDYADGEMSPKLSPRIDMNYPVLLLDSNGRNMYVDAQDFDLEEHPSFSWAVESLKKLREDIRELEKLPRAEASIWHLFQAQGGLLVLCQSGKINWRELKDGWLTHETIDPTEGGSSLDGFPLISINGASPIFADSQSKTLAHELAHNACNFLGIDFAQTALFKTCLHTEIAKNASPMVKNLNTHVMLMIKEGIYKFDQDYYSEMFARLQEDRLKNPKEFAEQLPLLDSFYKHCFYPVIEAALNRQEDTLAFMKGSIEAIGHKGTLLEASIRSKCRIEGQGKLDAACVDAEDECYKEAILSMSSPSSNLPNAQAKYDKASREAENYTKETQKMLEPFEEFLTSYMTSFEKQAEPYKKQDEKALTQWLADYQVSHLTTPEAQAEAGRGYVDKLAREGHVDLTKAAWKDHAPEIFNLKYASQAEDLAQLPEEKALKAMQNAADTWVYSKQGSRDVHLKALKKMAEKSYPFAQGMLLSYYSKHNLPMEALAMAQTLLANPYAPKDGVAQVQAALPDLQQAADNERARIAAIRKKLGLDK